MTVDDSIQSKTEDDLPKVNSEIAVAEHDTLKYRLLGPSLTKPGQDTVDQQKAIVPLDLENH